MTTRTTLTTGRLILTRSTVGRSVLASTIFAAGMGAAFTDTLATYTAPPMYFSGGSNAVDYRGDRPTIEYSATAAHEMVDSLKPRTT